MTTTSSVGEGNYEVKVTAEVENGNTGNLELKKYYRVTAASFIEAEKIVNAYIDYRENEEKSALQIPGVQELLDMESDEDYREKNWELIYFRADIRVQVGSTSELNRRATTSIVKGK